MTATRKRIGDIAVTAVSDGVLSTSLDVVIGLERAEAERLAGKKPGEPVEIPVNAFLLELDGVRVLIDTGAGNTMGPTLGKLADNLRAVGAPPESIDTILLTHLHSDHSNGLVDDDGRAIYPNAQLVLHEAEAAFWLDRDEASGADERIRRNIAKARVTTGPYRERMRTVRDGEALPGVSATSLAGHTPGHTGWLVHSGNDGLLIWGDVVHLAAVQVPHPEAALVFDVDPEAARATRVRTFDRVAADRLRVAGAHLDYPGFGHIVRQGASYRFEPDRL